MVNMILDYLKQKSTWTGGSSLLLLAGIFGVQDAQIQAICGIAIAIINAYDLLRKEKR